MNPRKIGLLIAFLVAGLVLAWGVPARAGDCGDSTGGIDTPCKCGDRVTTTTVLTGDDPVVLGVCKGVDALTVPDGVHLDLGGRTIRCAGIVDSQFGIVIAGDNVSVTNGIIKDCLTAVGMGAVSTTGSQVASIWAVRSRVGILVSGNNNRVVDNIADGQRAYGALDGIDVTGDSNTVVNNRCEDNAFTGLSVVGNSNTIVGNLCQKNGADGIDVFGTGNWVASNQGRTNKGHGINVGPAGNRTNGRNYGNQNLLKPDCLFEGAGGKYC